MRATSDRKVGSDLWDLEHVLSVPPDVRAAYFGDIARRTASLDRFRHRRGPGRPYRWRPLRHGHPHHTVLRGACAWTRPRPAAAGRDRFILSKGHCAAALYSVLALRGFISQDVLATFMRRSRHSNGHPNRRKVPGVEANTGPLGHGLPIAVGCAIASELSGRNWNTYVVLGDGELQEGSNWEAAMAAGHRGLDTLRLR